MTKQYKEWLEKYRERLSLSLIKSAMRCRDMAEIQNFIKAVKEKTKNEKRK